MISTSFFSTTGQPSDVRPDFERMTSFELKTAYAKNDAIKANDGSKMISSIEKDKNVKKMINM